MTNNMSVAAVADLLCEELFTQQSLLLLKGLYILSYKCCMHSMNRKELDIMSWDESNRYYAVKHLYYKNI